MLWYESRLPQVSQLNIAVYSIRNTIHWLDISWVHRIYICYLRIALQACTLYLLSTGAPLVQPGCLAV